MIFLYTQENKNLFRFIEFLKEKSFNYLRRKKENFVVLIMISDINKDLFEKIKNNFKPEKILKAEDADDFLDDNRYIKIDETKYFNDKNFEIIAGPCAVEDEEQMEKIGELLSKLDINFMRGGAFKPRTSPYQFQGLKERGLKLLKKEAEKYNFKIITEVMDIMNLSLVERYTDIIQIGSRNMFNYSLLKEVGKLNKPVCLKRGMSASYEEFLMAAEYIQVQGNQNIILCERGIKTFEHKTRFTLDLMAVPILKKLADYPVIVDPSHGTGSWDLILPAAKASLALKAEGIMIEVHPQPQQALSDGKQTLNFENFKNLVENIKG